MKKIIIAIAVLVAGGSMVSAQEKKDAAHSHTAPESLSEIWGLQAGTP